MKKALYTLLALLLIAPMGWAQYRELDNNFLFGSVKDTVGGINSTWTSGTGSTCVGRVISNTITSRVAIGTDPVLGTIWAPATRAWMEVTLLDTINAAGNGDVDSVQAFIQGIGASGCTTATFLDTLTFEWGAGAPPKNTTCIQEITPWLEYQVSGVQTAIGVSRMLPHEWRFFVSPADSGNNFAFPYAGGIGDSIVISCRVILEANGAAGAVPGL